MMTPIKTLFVFLCMFCLPTIVCGAECPPCEPCCDACCVSIPVDTFELSQHTEPLPLLPPVQQPSYKTKLDNSTIEFATSVTDTKPHQSIASGDVCKIEIVPGTRRYPMSYNSHDFHFLVGNISGVDKYSCCCCCACRTCCCRYTECIRSMNPVPRERAVDISTDENYTFIKQTMEPVQVPVSVPVVEVTPTTKTVTVSTAVIDRQWIDGNVQPAVSHTVTEFKPVKKCIAVSVDICPHECGCH